HGRQPSLDDQHGKGQDDQIGALESVLETSRRAIEDPVTEGGLEPRHIPSDPHDLPGQAPRAGGLGDRPTEEPDTDDGQSRDHAPPAPSTVESALMSRRFSSGVPTLTRSVVSIPKEVMGRTMTPSRRSPW